MLRTAILLFAVAATACNTIASPDAADVGNDVANDLSDASDVTFRDTGARDGGNYPDGFSCIVYPWVADGYDGGAVLEQPSQFLTNCLHNENTDLITWNGAIYLIYRTYTSQILSPDARLHVLRSMDSGVTFTEVRQFSYPGRDIRDPKFLVVGNELRIYSLSRLPVTSVYDLYTDAITTVARTTDGTTWTDPVPTYLNGWSFWREVQVGSRYYAAAYQDGDRSIIFLGSDDALNWTQLAVVFNDSCRIPLEPEPMFFDDGRVVVGVRLDDGVDYTDDGHEMLCIADPPYTSFTCPSELPGRLDGPRSFVYNSNRWVITRQHLSGFRKRTVLYRFSGNLHDAQGVGLDLIATFPSAGDTSYAGLTWLTPDRALVSWYSSNPVLGDVNWITGILSQTDIFLGQLDFTQPTDPATPFVRDGAVGPCRPLDPDGGMDATTGD